MSNTDDKKDPPPSPSEESKGFEIVGTPPGTPKGTNQGTVVNKMPYKPATPKLGGVEEVGTDLYAAWTGGKPKPCWSALEKKPDPIGPNQFRSPTIGGQAKSRQYRVHGLEEKFTKGSDLQIFKRKSGNT